MGNGCEVVKTSQVFKRAKVGGIESTLSLPNKLDDLADEAQKSVRHLRETTCCVAMKHLQCGINLGMRIMKYILGTPGKKKKAIIARF